MVIYVPGTEETDQKKQNMSLQQLGAAVSTIQAAWIAYVPTLSSSGGTLGTNSATGRYRQIGQTIHLQIYATVTTAGTGTGFLKATLPVNAAAFNYAGVAKESALTGKVGSSQIVGATAPTIVQAIDYIGTTFIADGGTVNYGITYEAA